MSDNRPELYPEQTVTDMYCSRIITREGTNCRDVPLDDFDIIRFAEDIGLTDEEILLAAIMARKRVGYKLGIELVDVDEKVIASQDKRFIVTN